MSKEKLIQVRNLATEVMENDIKVEQFFDLDSEEKLDLKIDVLTRLKNGVPPSEIPEYYSILELLPEDGQKWD